LPFLFPLVSFLMFTPPGASSNNFDYELKNKLITKTIE
jgi:hypothetical protein